MTINDNDMFVFSDFSLPPVATEATVEFDGYSATLSELRSHRFGRDESADAHMLHFVNGTAPHFDGDPKVNDALGMLYEHYRDHTLTERAARGAVELDRHYAGWYHNIDTSELDLASGSMCVAGQLMLSSWFSDSLGDSFPDHLGMDSGGFGSSAYETLTEAWRSEIAKRRTNGPFAPAVDSEWADNVGTRDEEDSDECDDPDCDNCH